jgi:hypothetical protein
MAGDDIAYEGTRDADGNAYVHVIQNRLRRTLPLRLDLANHSPTGFEWGYAGSGPAQLALALIAHASSDGGLAARLHQPFKWRVITKLPQKCGAPPGISLWRMTRADVMAHVTALLAQPDMVDGDSE